MRFSKKGEPCLYLGTTSFVCREEVQWKKEDEELYVASFKPNKEGRKLKILNLVVSQALINGVYNRNLEEVDDTRRKLQNEMLKIFPLIIATSFTVEKERKNDEIKYEYIVSQLLMKVTRKLGIDGIAYLSMQGKNEFQYPHGVNLAIPANDVSTQKEYSDYCKKFIMTKPYNIADIELRKYQIKKESYINTNYKQYYEYNDGYKSENFMSKVFYNGKDIFYGSTKYAKYDDFLVNQDFYVFNS